ATGSATTTPAPTPSAAPPPATADHYPDHRSQVGNFDERHRGIPASAVNMPWWRTRHGWRLSWTSSATALSRTWWKSSCAETTRRWSSQTTTASWWASWPCTRADTSSARPLSYPSTRWSLVSLTVAEVL